MIGKSLIAAAALAASVAAFAPAQQAQAGVHVNVTIGGGFYPAYGYGYYPPTYRNHYTISCRNGGEIVRNHNFRNVRPVDCRLPGYRYVGWKNGNRFVIAVNGRGFIAGLYRTY